MKYFFFFNLLYYKLLLIGDDTFYVLPNEATEDGFQAFTYLVTICHESDKYAIVKRIYSPNNKPRYYVLIPAVDTTPKYFVMTGKFVKSHLQIVVFKFVVNLFKFNYF